MSDVENEVVQSDVKMIREFIACRPERFCQFFDRGTLMIRRQGADEAALFFQYGLVFIPNNEYALSLYSAKDSFVYQGVYGIAHRKAVDAESFSQFVL